MNRAFVVATAALALLTSAGKSFADERALGAVGDEVIAHQRQALTAATADAGDVLARLARLGTRGRAGRA